MRFLYLLLLLCALSSCRGPGHWRETETVLGYRGQARINPFLAADRYLSPRLGVDVRCERSVMGLDYSWGTLILPAQFLETEGLGHRVMQWVENGGNLILLLEGGEAFYNDFTSRKMEGASVSELALELPGLEVVLDYLDLEIQGESYESKPTSKDDPGERQWHEIVATVWDEEYVIELEGQKTILDRESDEKSAFWDFTYGGGDVRLLTHARPLRNPYLDRVDHAAFLEALVGDDPYGDVIFVYGSGFSFWSLLWRYTWPILLAGLAVLVIWLWMGMPRFGPMRSFQKDENRQYGGQLLAGARFLWEKKSLAALVQPLRVELIDHYTKNQDGESGVINEAALVRMSEASGLKVDEVREAMLQMNFDEAAVLTRVVRHLKQLLNRL